MSRCINSKKSWNFILTKKTWNDIIEIPQNLEKEIDMDNKTILEAARNNKGRGREYENKESARSSLLGSAIAIVIGMILFLVEYFVKDSVNVSLIAVGMTAACVQSLYEGIKTKKTYLIVIGCVESLIVVFALLVFLAQVVS